MATKAERTLEKHGKKVVSIKDKIKEYEKILRQEEEREQTAKNLALVELVRNMNLSYDDVKEAINSVNAQIAVPAPARSKKPKTETTDTPETVDTAQVSDYLTRKVQSNEEID
jgi:hypothetical protein